MNGAATPEDEASPAVVGWRCHGSRVGRGLRGGTVQRQFGVAAAWSGGADLARRPQLDGRAARLVAAQPGQRGGTTRGGLELGSTIAMGAPEEGECKTLCFLLLAMQVAQKRL
jgi:hypothetical protein